MHDLTRFSGLVETIYDSALDPTRWPMALEGACHFVEGCAANLFYQSVVDNETSVFHSFGEDADYRDSYIARYCKLNPLFPASSFLEVGSVHSVSDIIPLDEFVETRLYKEWVRPQGILDALYTNLERTATGAAALAIRRRAADGLFDAEAKARFALLIPHVRRAITIGKMVAGHQATEAALSQTLDGLHAAVILVAADGLVVYVNAAGADMLSAGDVLHAARGRLAAVDPRADRDLHDAIAGAARGDADLGTKGIAIPLAAQGDSAQVAHILPLTSGQRRDLLHTQAAAALFVQNTTRSSPAPIETVTQLYRLTASEVRVLAAVAEFNGVPKMASALGLGEETVRSHLSNIFAKTGARRQVDLVKLLAGHASPLRV